MWALKTLQKKKKKKMKRRFLKPLISVMRAHVCMSYLSNMAYKSFGSFGMFNNCQISGAGVLFTAFSDFFK